MRKLGGCISLPGEILGWGEEEGKQRPGVGEVCLGILTWRWYLRSLGRREPPGQGVDRKDVQTLSPGESRVRKVVEVRSQHWSLVGSGVGWGGRASAWLCHSVPTGRVR